MKKNQNSITISPNRFDAAIFDLDGVITQTAKVHATAWKAMFDEFLEERPVSEKESHKPFDTDTDYREYVDGKPRYDGVKSFLESRGISLSYGEPNDSTNQHTICGLGNRKNQFFLKELEKKGVSVYRSTVTFIRLLRQTGIKMAVVSSSRNCQAVLRAANIEDLFNTRVDGTDLQRLNLAGKPAPDMFLEACHRLESNPRQTIGIEDAIAGIDSAQAANLGCIIGVNRGKNSEALKAHGSHIVVSDLAEITINSKSSRQHRTAAQLPSALESLNQIVPCNDDMTLAIFLDYDGTLTPIVPDPDEAVLTPSILITLQQLTELCKLAIISGRDLSGIRARVAIENIWYAGSHGFDISGPDGQHMEYQEGVGYLPALDAAEQTLRNKLESIPGCFVERKRFSIAIHYRQAATDSVATIKQMTEKIHADYPDLRLSPGKKILELQPDIEWNKGKALSWLMQNLGIEDLSHVIPLYIGDDVTDEDAFREIKSNGIGIRVGENGQSTNATYRLNNPNEVEQFLNCIMDKIRRR